MKLSKWFHIPPRTGNFFYKTVLPNSIFRSTLRFSVLFINKCLKIFMRKALALILQFVSLKLLEMSRIDCYAVRRIPENLAGGDIFSNFAGLLFWVYVRILFNIFLNFGWIFFQTALVGCFYKERIINKQELNYIYCKYNKILRQGIFHLGTKYQYEKYFPGYAGILSWTSGVSPGWTEWETSRPHINVITNLWRNAGILLILFIVASCLLSHSGSHINSLLDWSSKPLFQRLNHLKDSDNSKQY